MSGQLLDNESDLSADNNKDLYKLFEIKSQWTGHPLYFFHIHICSPILAVTYIQDLQTFSSVKTAKY